MAVTRRLALAGAASLAAPAIARADAPRRWRMVTSWGKNLVGPGVTAARLARRINTMSGGALEVQLFAAGEIVPALNVLDAVSTGTVEMGHTAALFWQGKMPAASLFTTMPFGLSPVAHAAWIDAEGQGLWDELYGQFNVKPFLAGNTGPSSAGWFRKPVQMLADIAGLRIRASGIGGELYRRLGATAVTISPGETYAALERGTIDAAEFLAPANDLALGLNRIAPLWEGLPEHLKAIIEAAARMEHDLGLAEAHRLNAEALRTLIEGGTQVHRLPEEVLAKGAILAEEILSGLSAKDALTARIVASYRGARNSSARAWEALIRS
jgi:TRAP-type mannitol/chloroaromatic compound transport system substrate-binding protein